jgi:UPF0716 family protein affecting phage T7 exclusion
MDSLKAHLFSREVVPFYLALIALGATTLLIDAALHLLGAVWVGRWLGIPGVLLIIGSLGYSLRKHKLIKWGQPAKLLRVHETMAWSGSLLVLVHAGIHFNAWLAWLAVWAMLITVASGLTGKYLLKRAKLRLDAARQSMREQGLSPEQLAERIWWDSLTFDVIKQWRVIHMPITLAFAVLALSHIVAVLLFWGWR